MRKSILAIIVLMSTVISACTAPIQIKTEPSGALITHEGANAGMSPTTIHASTLGFTTTTTIRVEKEGYHTAQKTISVLVNPWNGSMTWPNMEFIRLAKKEDKGK